MKNDYVEVAYYATSFLAKFRIFTICIDNAYHILYINI